MEPIDKLASPKFLDLGKQSWKELEEIMVRGETPDPFSLTGWEYLGMNIAPLAKYLGLQKFIKGFYRDVRGELTGYNISVRQNGLEAPWIYRHVKEPSKRFGFYRVSKVDPTARDNIYLQALLLDYSKGGNNHLSIVNLLRDYLVRVEKGSDELLLGKAFIALGRKRIVLSYFLLERYQPTL